MSEQGRGMSLKGDCGAKKKIRKSKAQDESDKDKLEKDEQEYSLGARTRRARIQGVVVGEEGTTRAS